MALNIKRKQTERLARQVAQRTGESITMAIEHALKVRAAQLDVEHDVEAKLARIRRYVASLPPLKPGPSGAELIDDLYDERGLPR